jgi:hypothetical protein
MALLRDLAGEDDWGLDALDKRGGRGGASSRASLLSQATREAQEREEVGSFTPGGEVMEWGGTGGATGIDLEEQEEVLSRFFRPHEVKRFMAVQREIDANAAAMRVRPCRLECAAGVPVACPFAAGCAMAVASTCTDSAVLPRVASKFATEQLRLFLRPALHPPTCRRAPPAWVPPSAASTGS